VLKTLGATRMRIVRTFSVEFSVLGFLRRVGVVFANLLTRVLLHRLEVAFNIDWKATAIALVATAVLATAPGGSQAIGFLVCVHCRCCGRSEKAGNEAGPGRKAGDPRLLFVAWEIIGDLLRLVLEGPDETILVRILGVGWERAK